MKSRKEALEDAISATKAAMAEGIVPGGGLALLRAIDAIAAEEARCDGDERTGLKMLRRALESPARQIAENSGADPGVTVGKMREGLDSVGFDAARGEFVDLVKAGKVAEAKKAFPVARGPWERIEPVAESFGDLDPMIDGREDVAEEGMEFTGFHRLEKDLWVDGLQSDSSAIADKLLVDVKEIVAKAKAVQLNPLQLANGSKALLDEVATGKITGEEDRYSHTDLYDFDENVKGSKAAIDALRPVLKARDAALLTDIDARFATLDVELDKHRTGGGFRLYTDLSKDEIRSLTVALDAVSEPISQVAGVVASR
jgi:iron uptake system EfeUOB component EfeO/EfeM